MAVQSSHHTVLYLATFSGISNFFNNSAAFSGGAINAEVDTSLCFIGTSNFTNNWAVQLV